MRADTHPQFEVSRPPLPVDLDRYSEMPQAVRSSLGKAKAHNDDELLERLLAGDEEAFACLCKRHEHQLFRTAYRIMRNEDDAMDVVQDAFMNAYRRIDSFRADSSLSTWLTRIVINCSFMHLRKKKRQHTVSLEEPSEETMSLRDTLQDHTVDIEGALLRKEELRMLDDAILRLRRPLRETIELYRRQDLSMIELAEHCGVTLAAAKSRLLRARIGLRQGTQGASRQKGAQETSALLRRRSTMA